MKCSKVSYLSLLAATLATAGCAYNAPVSLSPAYNVYSSYEDKVPGKWALWVDGSNFRDDSVKASSHTCSAHSFPIDSSGVFEKSTLQTFGNLVEEIERVDTPIPSSRLAEYGFDGQLIVTSEDMDVDLVVIPSFFSATAEAEVEYEASLSAHLKSGKVLGTTVSAEGEDRGEAGGACEGAAVTIGKAAEEGMKKILRDLGERFSSSSRLREQQAKELSVSE